MDADRIEELRQKVARLSQTTLMGDLLEVTNELLDEIEDGDYWKQKSIQFQENGSCPVCFCSDEEGHKNNCEWGAAELDRDLFLDALRTIVTAKSGKQIVSYGTVKTTVTLESIQRFAKETIERTGAWCLKQPT